MISDPPYPEISRAYGRLPECDWHDLMNSVVKEARRILKPTGSAVFVLQPNSEHVGTMRPWLWEFMAHWAKEWNLIQDFYVWNPATPPNVHCQRKHGLLRPSVKYCVWLGSPDCYRNQEEILWSPTQSMTQTLQSQNYELRSTPSGYSTRIGRIAETVRERGKVTPYNLLPLANTSGHQSPDHVSHGAQTPLALCHWWTRYLAPPQGTIIDPFAGVANTGVAALQQGKTWIGIELLEEYADEGRRRLTAELENLRPAWVA